MTPTFTLTLGGFNLAPYAQMNPEAKFDVYGAPWLEPAFTETPFADAQPLISTTVGNRESMLPLFLNEPSKDLLHQLIREINVAATVRPLLLEWKDDGASKPTFFDVAFVRFEPDYSFRRSQHQYAAGTLHLWVAGYAHTGTVRIAGTAAGTGIFLSVPMPSIAGDAPALLDTTISAGAVVPSLGRIVALAPISHPSYTPLITAEALLSVQAGATLNSGPVNASGAQAHQYLALPVSPTGGASGIACKVPLPNPTIAGGDNRILAVVKSGINGGVAVTALDPYGNVIGATAVASMSAGWGLIDLGVCRLPTVGFPTRPELSILAGGVWASGAEGPAIISSPGFALNEIICLPDKNLTLVLENFPAGGSQVSQDSFPGAASAALDTTSDQEGHLWLGAYNNQDSTGFYVLQDGFGKIYNGKANTALDVDGVRLQGVQLDPMLIIAQTRWNIPGASSGEELRLFKDIASGAYAQAQAGMVKGGAGFLALSTATNGTLHTLASVAVPTVGKIEYKLSFKTNGPVAALTFSRIDAGPVFPAGASAAVATLEVSDPAVAGAGAPAIALTNAPSSTKGPFQVSHWEVQTIPGNAVPAESLDAYRFDGPHADVYRTAQSGVFAGQKLMAVQRGAFPKAAPSTSSIAIVCAPFDQGVANDILSAVVSVTERFFYAR